MQTQRNEYGIDPAHMDGHRPLLRGKRHMAVAEGNGPVNALDNALRKVLLPIYPELGDMRLLDYKVRILTPNAGTEALTRVMIESGDELPTLMPRYVAAATSSQSASVLTVSVILLRSPCQPPASR